MDRPSHEEAAKGGRPGGPGRMVRGALPLLAAAAGTAVAALRVFPEDPATGFLVAVVCWAAYGASVLSRRPTPLPPATPERDESSELIDPETGLGNARELERVLLREIARAKRYGDRSALAIFEFAVVGFRPSAGRDRPPSPARHIAATLAGGVRGADFVMRLDRTRFAILLTECDIGSARTLIERLRTGVAAHPYARNADESGVYTRSMAAAVAFAPEFAQPLDYVGAALAELDRTRPGYEAEQTRYRGGPTVANASQEPAGLSRSKA